MGKRMYSAAKLRGVRCAESEPAVLLTGATGFVGGALLARLTARQRRRVICLLRAGSPQEAEARGDEALARALGAGAHGVDRSRVRFVAGDLIAPGLGMSDSARRALAREVREIFHCAASTEFDLPLPEARQINLGGVRAIHAFAAEAAAAGGLRRLHHVSTAYASGRARGTVLAEVLPPDGGRRFRNAYERSKAEAERFLRANGAVPTTVYRPSIIVGDSHTGRTTNWKVVYFPMRLMALGMLPFAPCGGEERLDCVPIDHVADAILALGRRPDSLGRTFHVTSGRRAPRVRDVIRHLYAGLARQRGTPLVLGTTALSPLPWWFVAQGYRLLARGRARAAFARFRVYVPYTRVSAVYDNERETKLLAEEDVRLTPPEEFLPLIVDYALAHDFGRHVPQKTDGQQGEALEERLAATREASPWLDAALGR
jgi:thioester reductase-like protein